MEKTINLNSLPFLISYGEMATLIRNHDWASTVLGDSALWPACLRISLGNMLNSGFPMMLFWGDDLICFYNDAFREILGEGNQHSAMGRKAMDVWQESWKLFGPIVESVRTSGTPVTFEDHLMPFYRNGRMEDVYWTLGCSVVIDEEGHHSGILVNCFETANIVHKCKEAAENEGSFPALIQRVSVPTAIFNGDELLISAINQPMIEIFGKGNIKGMRLEDAVPEIRNQPFPGIIREVLQTGISYEGKEMPAILERDGVQQTYYFDFSYQPIRNTKGAVYGVMDMAIDVTAKVQARKKLEASESRLALLSNAVPAMIFYLDEKERYVTYNETFMDWYNVGAEEVIGKTVKEFLGDEGYSVVAQHLLNAFSGVQEKFEIKAPERLSKKDMWISIVYTPDFDQNNEVKGLIVHATDVTQSKKTEMVLRESEERFRSLADNSPMFVFLIDASADARVSYWNKKWLDYTGQTMEEATGTAWDGIIHPQDVPFVLSRFSTALTNRQPYIIPAVRVKRHDGEYRWHSFHGNPRELAGEFMGYVGVGFDIHEQKITEEKLEELVEERTKALQFSNNELQRSNQNLEEFAHAASHDLKEPVRKIMFFTNQLKENLGTIVDETELKSLNRIQNASERMGKLIDDLLLYSHISHRPLDMEHVDLNQKIMRIMDDLELDIRDKKATFLFKKLPVVKGYRRQLQQLFQNLISNALKYSKQNVPPVITIDAINVIENGMPYHEIIVKDNGIGFKQEYEEKIFQMFSRLHGRSEYSGTGIGLSIVKKVVENHKGFVRVESSLGDGATFRIFFPV